MTWTDLGDGRSRYRPASPDDWRIGPDALRPYLNQEVLAVLDSLARRRRRWHGLADVRRSLRDGAWTAVCTCGGIWRALEYATAVAAVNEVCDQPIMTWDEIMGRETDELDAALSTAVQLSREAVAAGLIVTELAALKCHGAYGNCFLIQIWQADGGLWAEGSHETVESVRQHIHSYARGRSNEDMAADQEHSRDALARAGWTEHGPGMWTAPAGTPEPVFYDRLAVGDNDLDEITGGSDEANGVGPDRAGGGGGAGAGSGVDGGAGAQRARGEGDGADAAGDAAG